MPNEFSRDLPLVNRPLVDTDKIVIEGNSASLSALKDFATQYQLFHLPTFPSYGKIPYIFVEEHFCNSSGTMVIGQNTNGAFTVAAVTPEVGRAGIVRLGLTATANPNRVGYSTSTLSFMCTGGRFRTKSLVRLNNLSNAIDRFGVNAGLLSSAGGSDASCVCFRYRDDSFGGNWSCLLRNGSGGETFLDTGLPAAAGQFYLLEIEVDPSAPYAKFWIDGRLVATATTNIPTSTTTGWFPVNLYGVLGTATVSVDIDYASFRFDPLTLW